jgi:hypothetical protein
VEQRKLAGKYQQRYLSVKMGLDQYVVIIFSAFCKRKNKQTALLTTAQAIELYETMRFVFFVETISFPPDQIFKNSCFTKVPVKTS